MTNPFPPQGPQGPTGPTAPQGGNSLLNSFNDFRRRSPVLAGVAVLIVVCLLCGICGSIGKAMGGGSTAANGAAVVGSGSGSDQSSGPTATPAPTATATATPKPKAWVTIKTFSGSATTQTDTFAIPDGAHINWSCSKSDSFGGNFDITLYGSDGSELDLVANTTDNDHGTYTLHQPFGSDGKYYLKVETYSENWKIDVQAYQ